MADKVYDLIIIGAGPSGLSASIYASRYKLDHLVIGSEIGGQVVEAWEIENYPGLGKISGKELMEKFRNQAEGFGVKIAQATVIKVNKKDDIFEILCEDKKTYLSKNILFALGMKPKRANILGEDKFVGKGVSYCATCDAMFFRGKEVVVVGGGDSAATAALYMADFASKVYFSYRGELRCEPSWCENIKNNPKIEALPGSVISEIKGDKKVSSVTYEVNGEKKELPVEGVFIEVGTFPGVIIAKELGIKMDEQDYIIVDQTQATNVENVYAAGDVTTGSNKFRQIATAVAEGAVAVGAIYKKLKLKK